MILQSKCKSFHLFVVVFLCILAGWKSYKHSWRTIGVQQGRGSSHRESYLLSTGCLGVVFDSQSHSYAQLYSHPD